MQTLPFAVATGPVPEGHVRTERITMAENKTIGELVDMRSILPPHRRTHRVTEVTQRDKITDTSAIIVLFGGKAKQINCQKRFDTAHVNGQWVVVALGSCQYFQY